MSGRGGRGRGRRVFVNSNWARGRGRGRDAVNDGNSAEDGGQVAPDPPSSSSNQGSGRNHNYNRSDPSKGSVSVSVQSGSHQRTGPMSGTGESTASMDYVEGPLEAASCSSNVEPASGRTLSQGQEAEVETPRRSERQMSKNNGRFGYETSLRRSDRIADSNHQHQGPRSSSTVKNSGSGSGDSISMDWSSVPVSVPVPVPVWVQGKAGSSSSSKGMEKEASSSTVSSQNDSVRDGESRRAGAGHGAFQSRTFYNSSRSPRRPPRPAYATRKPRPVVKPMQPTLEEPEVKVKPLLDSSSTEAPEFKVLNNVLVFDNIAKYLDHSSLKAFGATCTWILELTRQCPIFINNTKLNIWRDKPQVVENISTTLKPFYFPWKTVSLDVDGWKTKQLNTIKGVLEGSSVEILELYEPPSKTKPVCILSGVSQIILRAQMLKSLRLDHRLLSRPGQFFSNKLKKNLGGLENLAFTNLPHRTGTDPDFMTGVHSPHQHNSYCRNLSRFQNIPGMKLKSLEFSVFKILSMLLHINALEVLDTNAFVEPLVALIEQNKNSLERLVLKDYRAWRSEKLKTIVCPSLKSLDLTISESNVETVAAFLENQPLLEGLSIRLIGKIRSMTLPDAVRRRSGKLKLLHLNWIVSSYPREGEAPIILEWSYLQDLAHLEDIKIRHFYADHRRSTIQDVMPNLPVSLKKVTVNGQKVDAADDEVEVFGFGFPFSGNVTPEHLSRFSRLTHLSLLNCRGSLSDDTFQYICQRLTQLLVLEFSHCHYLTDFGLTGERGAENTGFSLRNLTGLRKLTIGECRGITLAAVTSVVAFLELKDLTLCPPNEWNTLHPNAVKAIALQNPSLEKLTLGMANLGFRSAGHLSDGKVEKDIKKKIPRFKHLVVTLLELEVEDSEDDDITDSSEFGDGDSDGSGFDFGDDVENWGFTDSEDDYLGDMDDEMEIWY